MLDSPVRVCRAGLRALFLALMPCTLAMVTACAKFASSASVTSSISLASSASSSEIISSPFRSSSRSPCCQEEQKIEEETEGYTTAYLSLGGPGDAESFLRGLAAIAARHGLSDWQRNPNSWMGVARGLAAADLSEAESLQYAQRWANGDPVLVSLLKQMGPATRARTAIRTGGSP